MLQKVRIMLAPSTRAASLGVAEGHSVAIDGVIDDDPDARPALTYLRVRITRILSKKVTEPA